jgi:hypothetical protein
MERKNTVCLIRFFHKCSDFLNKMSGVCMILNLYVQQFKMFLDICVDMLPGGKTKQSLEHSVFCGMTQCSLVYTY